MIKYNLKIAGIILFLIWAVFGLGVGEARAVFGPEQPAKTNFGSASKPAAIDDWIAGSYC